MKRAHVFIFPSAILLNTGIVTREVCHNILVGQKNSAMSRVKKLEYNKKRIDVYFYFTATMRSHSKFKCLHSQPHISSLTCTRNSIVR